MPSTNQEIGRCPLCDSPITEFDVIIRYGRDNQTKRYAECPNCEEVVGPEN
ncbi:DUF7837 family putative zinc-binding protein [Halodesulfurarchaeum formicicum]|uniref:Small CPxCG-related zinc finger protein n=1 Tax=Halodesulfurarchaeum formicicum TaxID=1873524 RepID=A0A1J1AD88_9EURY|nr:small CPxCG-related zinc finger protein [Halodesulfurarchaeum formicicum]